MKTKSPYAIGLAALLAVCMLAPLDLPAEPQAAGQKAGEVSRVIPAVSIARGAKTLTAAAKSAVEWQDLVNTKADARARIELNDGSVLNVGSESSLKIVKHDAGAQQTELELTYGKLRTQAQKIVKPDGKFEVRTPAGVAGVVGTDFYAGYENNQMNVIVYEGQVRVCNLAGVCVLVKAGQMSSVRNGNNEPPSPPTQAPLDVLVTAGKDTNPGDGNSGLLNVGHIGKAWGITLGVVVITPLVVLPVLYNHGTRKPVIVVGQGGCSPTNPSAC